MDAAMLHFQEVLRTTFIGLNRCSSKMKIVRDCTRPNESEFCLGLEKYLDVLKHSNTAATELVGQILREELKSFRIATGSQNGNLLIFLALDLALKFREVATSATKTHNSSSGTKGSSMTGFYHQALEREEDDDNVSGISVMKALLAEFEETCTDFASILVHPSKSKNSQSSEGGQSSTFLDSYAFSPPALKPTATADSATRLPSLPPPSEEDLWNVLGSSVKEDGDGWSEVGAQLAIDCFRGPLWRSDKLRRNAILLFNQEEGKENTRASSGGSVIGLHSLIDSHCHVEQLTFGCNPAQNSFVSDGVTFPVDPDRELLPQCLITPQAKSALMKTTSARSRMTRRKKMEHEKLLQGGISVCGDDQNSPLVQVLLVGSWEVGANIEVLEAARDRVLKRNSQRRKSPSVSSKESSSHCLAQPNRQTTTTSSSSMVPPSSSSSSCSDEEEGEEGIEGKGIEDEASAKKKILTNSFLNHWIIVVQETIDHWHREYVESLQIVSLISDEEAGTSKRSGSGDVNDGSDGSFTVTLIGNVGPNVIWRLSRYFHTLPLHVSSVNLLAGAIEEEEQKQGDGFWWSDGERATPNGESTSSDRTSMNSDNNNEEETSGGEEVVGLVAPSHNIRCALIEHLGLSEDGALSRRSDSKRSGNYGEMLLSLYSATNCAEEQFAVTKNHDSSSSLSSTDTISTIMISAPTHAISTAVEAHFWRNIHFLVSAYKSNAAVAREKELFPKTLVPGCFFLESCWYLLLQHDLSRSSSSFDPTTSSSSSLSSFARVTVKNTLMQSIYTYALLLLASTGEWTVEDGMKELDTCLAEMKGLGDGTGTAGGEEGSKFDSGVDGEDSLSGDCLLHTIVSTRAAARKSARETSTDASDHRNQKTSAVDALLPMMTMPRPPLQNALVKDRNTSPEIFVEDVACWDTLEDKVELIQQRLPSLVRTLALSAVVAFDGGRGGEGVIVLD